MSEEEGKCVYRYSIDKIGEPVGVATSPNGQVLAVAMRSENELEFWVEHVGGVADREFLVVGTGPAWSVPWGATHRGTTARTPAGMVWHLYELPERT